MQQFWNKKRISLLAKGDRDTLELFLSQYQPAIFTWMYYQVGADANIAADLTGRTFALAISKIKEFSPADSMFRWLKEQAKTARDEGLLHWQLKPQRPWAWSQLPDSLLGTISQIRSEPLNEATAANPFVQEIVQATLAELEQDERELMMHRYNHLDTPENIADEMNLSVEKVNDLLYKCRHSFRRTFFYIISSVNPGFAESNSGTGIEVLDNNLEKLLRSTAMYQVPSEAQSSSIREKAIEAAGDAIPAVEKRFSPFALAGIAAGVLLLIAIVVIVSMSKEGEKQPEKAAAKAPASLQQQADAKSQTAKPQQSQESINEEELKLVFKLGQEGNLAALLEILKSGQYTSQVAAAHFVGKFGNPSSVEILARAQDQWYPDGPRDNPFYQAITEIASRYPGEIRLEQAQRDIPKPTQPVVDEKAAKEFVAIEGSVHDISGRPISGAEIEITANPLLSNRNVDIIASATSNAEGVYQVKQSTEGPCFMRCSSPENNINFRQAFWSSKGHPCKYDIDGRTTISGNVAIIDQPLSGLRLILSDTLEPDKAAFRAETAAGEHGSFVFPAVSPGFYNLFSIKENGKLVRLTEFEIRQHENLNLQFNMRPISIIVEYPDPNMISDGRICYQMEHSNLHEEKSAKASKKGKLRFENVFAGSYLLQVQLRNGMTLQQEIEVQPDAAEQVITLDALTNDLVSVRGKLVGKSPIKLFLLSMDQRTSIALNTNTDGTYELVDIPAETYSLASFIKGQLIEFTQIKLQSGPQILMDLNLEHILGPFSPLYIVTTNKDGLIVSNARVMLDNDDVNVAYTTGQGAFMAAPAGNHHLRSELEGYGSADVKIELKKALLNAEPSPDNTFRLEF